MHENANVLAMPIPMQIAPMGCIDRIVKTMPLNQLIDDMITQVMAMQLKRVFVLAFFISRTLGCQNLCCLAFIVFMPDTKNC